MNVTNGNVDSGTPNGASASGGAPAGAGASATGAQGGAAAPSAPQGGGQSNPPAGSFQWPTNWKENLPAELRDEGSLKAIMDIPALAKSFVHAQKAIGSDKIVIPSKHASDDDWRQVFGKLGNPEKVEDYKFEVPADSPFDEKFVNNFKEIAHKNGVLPKQAEGLVKWFAEASKAEAAGYENQVKADFEKNLTSLKAEWGNAYDGKLAKAQAAVEKFGGKELMDYLTKSGLGNQGPIIKAFANAASIFGEDKLTPNPPGGGITPGDATQKITQIFGDKTHPYHLKDHPGHKSAVAEMNDLFVQKNAGQAASAVGAGFISFNARS